MMTDFINNRRNNLNSPPLPLPSDTARRFGRLPHLISDHMTRFCSPPHEGTNTSGFPRCLSSCKHNVLHATTRAAKRLQPAARVCARCCVAPRAMLWRPPVLKAARLLNKPRRTSLSRAPFPGGTVQVPICTERARLHASLFSRQEFHLHQTAHARLAAVSRHSFQYAQFNRSAKSTAVSFIAELWL